MTHIIRPYDAMLIGRARAWGALCMAAAGGREATWRRMVGDGDRADVERMVDRLVATGLAERVDDDGEPVGVRLTERGRDAAARTRHEGVVPSVVQDDPTDWRQRAWTSIRIRGRFTAADVAGAADAPSMDSLSAYLRELVASGHLARRGFETRGRHGRWAVYQLVDDSGPVAPDREPRTQEREHDPSRPWRRRAWSALWRLGRTGEGVRVAELAAAAHVPSASAGKLLAELCELGALVRSRAEAEHGRPFVYALTPEARERAEPALRRSDRPAGRAEWRRRAWAALVASGTITAPEAAEAGGGSVSSARPWLRELARAGYVVRSDAPPPAEAVYSLSDDAPCEMPTVTVPRPSRASAASEGALSDA